MILIPTSHAEHLAQGFNYLKLLPNKDGKRRFPDGEVYVRLPELTERHVLVLHSGIPEPNSGLIELELVLTVLREQGIRTRVFFSYFPYGMQDRVFEPGEPNSAESLVKKLVEWYGVEKIYLLDAHFWGREWVSRYPLENFSALPLLIEKARKDWGDFLLLSPDVGAERRTGIKGLKKKRLDSFRVEFSDLGDVSGKTVAVIDDLVETGGTLVRLREKLREAGAKDAIALITHGVLPEGIRRVKEAYSALYLTNSINRPEANVDIRQIIQQVLK